MCAVTTSGPVRSAGHLAREVSTAFLVLMGLWIGLGNRGLAQGNKDTKPGEAKKAKEAPANSKTTKTKKKSGVVNRNNDAYEKIKSRRREIVKKYLEVLFAAADQCAEQKKIEACRTLTDRILKVVEPPRNRRKVSTTASGVAVDKEGERAASEGGGEPRLLEVKQKPLSPEDEAILKDARERIAKIHEKAGITADGGGKSVAQPRPPSGDPVVEKKDPKRTGPTVVKGPDGKDSAGDAGKGKAPKGKGVEDAELKERGARAELIRQVKDLCLKCVEQGFPAQAYEILLWAIDLDPDNESLRKNVRQYKFKDKDGKIQWYSPFEMQKAQKGYIQHPDYGWVTPVEIKALKSGKLWFKGQWRQRDEVETERQKWENRWTFETEHFEISTNADLGDVVMFGREVERLYSFFFRIFIDFYSTGNANEDSKLVFGGGKDLVKQKLKLHYYRSREHFLSEIAKDPECNKFPNPPGKDPLIAQSAGFYWGATHKAYFYRGPNGPDLSVIYHEVTHQVFGETYNSGANPPTWLVEGLGVFMEDPVVRGERLIAGAEPPPGVRKKDFRDINNFVKTLQNHNQFHGGGRGDNYATAGAVIHFFLFYKGGLYRQPFMQYAREAYHNNSDDSPTPISKLYEYLPVTPDQLQQDWEAFNVNPDLFDF